MADHNFHILSTPKTVEALAKIIEAEIQGDGSLIINDVAALDKAGEGHITFLDNIKYKESFTQTKASVCIVDPQMAEFAPSECTLLISKNPYKSYALIAQTFYPEKPAQAEISEHAMISKSSTIGAGCCIEAGVVIKDGANIGAGCWIESGAIIGDNVSIGSKCRVGSNAVISHAIIGEATRVYPGVCIGQDGFGFAIDPAGHVKVPQLGRVIIGDNVEIGANSCVDRGAGPDTTIGNGVWIDNCVQIGHNVKIGNGCVIVAQSGVAGSSTLEDYVVVAAQVGIAGHLKIGMGSRIAGKSGIMRNLPAGSEVMGYPAVPIKQFMKQIAYLNKLTKPKKSE